MFVTTITQLIQKELVLEERKMPPEYVINWIQFEAIEQEYLAAYGSFKQALFCYVEDRILPILSNIISSINQHGNLMILFNQPEYIELWISLFSKVIFIPNFVSEKLSDETFDGRFPFSAQICKEISSALRTHILPGKNYFKNMFIFKNFL